MGHSDRYSSSYPRQGEVAVLCEGDIVGFEVDLLEKFTAASTSLLVDVWPCGTRNSIYGFSDVIGRSRPIAIIEDRDFRTWEEALDECGKMRRDRTERGVRLCYWKTWQRHEIENYLIEPDVIVPVIVDAFAISEAEALDRLTTVISVMGVDQAAQRTLYRWGMCAPGNEPSRYRGGLPRKTGRPRLDGTTGRPAKPSNDVVRAELDGVLRAKRELVGKDSGKVEVQCVNLMGEFEQFADRWSKLDVAASDWRVEWAGKELLALLLRWLTQDPGRMRGPDGSMQRVDWEALEKIDKGITAKAAEREIVREMQPKLVESFLSLLARTRSNEILDEWKSLVSALKVKPTS